MLWTVVACSQNVDRLRQTEVELQNGKDAMDRCLQIARDVMVFAGLIRFKLPARVWDALAAVGGELGGF